MGFDIRVMATGVVALCLILAATISMSSVAYPDLQQAADRFFALAVTLIAAVIILAMIGIKVRIP